MKRSITRTLFLGILALLLAWSPAYAKQVATVVAARGDVQALDAKGKSRTLPVQAPIFEEDTIKTGEHSRVQIMFTDNTLINLGNATTMKIAEYRWQPEQNDGALKTQVKEGTFRVMGGALTKTAPQNFKTETPTATIGIRGSMYAGVVTPDFLSVVFQGGKGIEITNAFGTVEISKPGFGTKVAMAKPPLPPMKFTAQEMGEMNKALSGNGAGEKEEKKEDKKEKGEDKGKKEDKGAEKAPAAKEEQSTAPAPAEKQADSTAPAADSQTVSTAPAPASEPAPADTLTANGWATTTMDPALDTAPALAPVTLATPPVGLLVQDLTGDLVADNTQKDIITTVTDTVVTAVANSITLSGRNHFFLRDINLALLDPSQFDSTFLDYAAGPFTAKLFDTGEIYGTFSNGKPFGPYLIDGYDPNASYLGFGAISQNIPYVDDRLGPLNLTATIYGDPSAQFFYSTSYTTIDSTPDYLLGSLVYAGIPSTSIPTAGINMFTGHLIYNNTSVAYPDADMEKTSIEVNYYNRRLIGRSQDMNPANIKNDGAVFFGTVNSNGTADVIILGGGGTTGTNPTATYGTASANLYGRFNQGLGFTASGADYYLNDINNTQHSTWQATGAALRDVDTEFISPYPTLPIAYTGFVVGVADNTATSAASRIFMNSTSSGFTMSANPTTGTISGSLSANELLFGGIPLSNITIGHATDLTKSAYVLNDQMVAILSDADPNYTLSSYGNFLYTAGPDDHYRVAGIDPSATPSSDKTDYLSWGYWEMAYTDPNDPAGSQSKDHLFSSQSFWIAGNTTPTVSNTTISGTYLGGAQGVHVINNSSVERLPDGTTSLTVNFTATPSVIGTITFPGKAVLTIGGSETLSGYNYTAKVSAIRFESDASPTATNAGYDQLRGAMYGPNAEATGGSFNAAITRGTDTHSYYGIFGGIK